MNKELIEKRKALIAEFDAIKVKAETEKRSAYTNEERTRVNEIKIELSDIDARIADEKEINEKRNVKLDLLTQATPTVESVQAKDEFRSFIQSGKAGKFTMPMSEFEKRATVTTTSNPSFKFTDMKDGLSVAEHELVLQKLGGQVAYFDAGNVDYPSITNIIGTFGTEDSTIADQSLVSVKKTLVPTFVSASIEVSKSFLLQSKSKNIDDLKNALVYGIQKAVERRVLNSLSGATSATGSTAFNKAIHAESLILGTGTGYIASKDAVKSMKQEKVDAGSAVMTMTNGQVNGYPALRSTLATANNVYYGDFSATVQAYWGDSITLETITDGSMARKGNVLIIASAMADGSVIDFNKVAKFTA